jgi:hypothetical protein
MADNEAENISNMLFEFCDQCSETCLVNRDKPTREPEHQKFRVCVADCPNIILRKTVALAGLDYAENSVGRDFEFAPDATVESTVNNIFINAIEANAQALLLVVPSSLRNIESVIFIKAINP